MRSWHLFLTTFFMLLFGSMYAQTVGTQTFSATGIDSDNFQLVVVPSDITVNGGETIQSVTISDFTVEYLATGNMDECGTWYGFDLAVTGGTSDGVSIPEGCIEDFQDMDVTDFTNMSLTSQDIDDWSDNIYIELVLEVTYGDGGGTSDYCTPEGINANRYIDNFSTTGGGDNISNLASGYSVDGYGDFYDTQTVSQDPEGAVNFTADIMGGTAGFRIWVDWNQDGTFDTTEEVAYNSTGYLSTQTGSFNVPADAMAGETRMRVVSHWLSTTGDVDPCATEFNYGEFEDYKFVVNGGGDPEPVYCTPEGINVNRYIDNFSTTGGGDNISNLASGYSVDGYGDFYDTQTVSQDPEGTVNFTADIMGGTAGFRIWVDWNQDGTFDTTEEVAYNSTGYLSTQTGSFNVPADAMAGETRMRVVSHWLSTTGDVDPCATEFDYGEFEDYKFVVNDGGSGTEGCLDAPNGQYPTGAAYVPACVGTPEAITTAAWTGEYSLVQVTAGTEYTFSSSIETDFITIGNEDGTVALASGVTPITWTADADQVVRFYLHLADDCSSINSGLRSRIVQCGEPYIITEPDFPCFQGDGLASNGPENGYGVDPADIYRVADDFFVDAGTEFVLQQVSLNVLSSSAVDNATFNIHADEAGAPSATIVGTFSMAPTESNIFGTAFSFAAYNLKFDLASPITLPEGTYWLEPTISNTGGTTVYWEMSSTGSHGAIVELSNTSGTTWVPDDSGDNYQAVFFVAGECNTVAGPDGCLEADPDLPQWPTSTFVPACNGSAEVIATNCWTGEYSMVQVTAGTEYTFSSSVDTDMVTISDEAGTTVYAAGIATVTWTAPADELIRFYLHLDEDCNWGDDVSRSRIVQCGEPGPPQDGCLTASFGQYPTATFVPACIGSPQVITDLAYAGEYSMVQVTAGTEYIFSSSIGSDFITIGDEAGENVLAYGQGPLTWTADADQLVRFYVHVDDTCMESTDFRARMVQCGEVPPPPSACTDFVVLSNNLENGLFFEGDTAQHMAVDVPVADQGFTVYGMEPTVIGEASMFTFIIYEDAGGLPGAEIDTKTGTIVGEEYTGTNFGYDFYKYSVAFDSSIDFAANTTYWIEVQSDAVAWESESVLTLGNDDVFYNTNVGEGVWTPTGGDQFVFNLACEPLAINDMNSFSFTYYPNPVKDYLTIDAKKGIENITVHNLAGQTVLQGAKAVDGRVNMSSLSAGVYIFRVTLEGGQVETFKVIKK